MATEEHKRLAATIKDTHALLREEFQKYGADVAWQRHMTRNDMLQIYADSMQKLATIHWPKDDADDNHICRVQWIKDQCRDYFFNGGKEKYNNKERHTKMKIDNIKTNGTFVYNCDVNFSNSKEFNSNIEEECTNEKIELLDVGSCYNPFKVEDMFNTTAIDILAIPGNVFKCDFLNVDLGREMIFVQDKYEIIQLCYSYFDAIVFSLLLEYLPCPEQRYVCCKKAYHLLKPEGVLLIISPDSKHVGANAKFMKSWRYVLAKLGFMRIKYEKFRHIHCIMFRKCQDIDVPLRWTHLQTLPENDPLYESDSKIFIPQDFNHFPCSNKKGDLHEHDAESALVAFNQLPFADV